MHKDEKRYVLPIGKLETNVKHHNCYSLQIQRIEYDALMLNY